MYRKLSLFLAGVMLVTLMLPATAGAAGGGPNPAAVRAAAINAGMAGVEITPGNFETIFPDFWGVGAADGDYNDFSDFLVDATPATKARLVQLGKAMYWDQQVGSDGQACASCHFGGVASGFADSRTKNEVSPNQRAGDSTFQNGMGPNYQLTTGSFPIESNDVISSQGVFSANYTGYTPGAKNDTGIPIADPVFNVAGVNTRVVPPRNTPSAINSIYNVANFWDGRAHPIFNGVTPVGPVDASAAIKVAVGVNLVDQQISIPNASLASQSVGPPLSTGEMSYAGRIFPDIGKKLLDDACVPLGYQRVHPEDSVLAPLANSTIGGHRVITWANGLDTTYKAMIQGIFKSKYWNSTAPVNFTGAKNNPYSQMEANFTLFWGLAIQAYESTLINDTGLQASTPFDRFMAGDDTALTAAQLEGLLVFINTGEFANDPIFNGVSRGMCSDCHYGAEFSNATYTSLVDAGAHLGVELMLDGNMDPSGTQAVIELGFANIGVRPSSEDLGRGNDGEAGPGAPPISFGRQAQQGLAIAPENSPNPALHVAVDGAFKVPGLRNIEMTAPYMHNGGEGTLEQVFRFYQRRGDFSRQNAADCDPVMAEISLRGGDEDIVVAFLKSLTDDRVRNELAPFDHPQLVIPNGYPGNNVAITSFTTIATPAGDVKVATDDPLTIAPTGNGGIANEPGFVPPPTFPQPPPALNFPQTGNNVAGTWSLISTPVTLAAGSNTLAGIYGASMANVQTAYAWNGAAWDPLVATDVLTPLDAWYIKVADGKTAVATFVADPDATPPATKTLVAGINLVGLAPIKGPDGTYGPMPLDQALTSVAPTGTARGYITVISPAHQQAGWVYIPGVGTIPTLEPFVGYWVIMDNIDTLYGFSTTP